MQLSPHFTAAEFIASTKAQQLGIDNALPDELLQAAIGTAQMLERIRAFLSERARRAVPLVLSSGYRCLALNRAVGSADTSDHPRAMAADWSAPAFGSPFDVCQALAPQVSVLGIGQLIHECPAPGRLWVHTSTRTPANAANRVITISAAGTCAGIHPI